jgi:signal transduction histidine kinase
LATLSGALTGAELAQRDYLLTGDPKRRAEYEHLTVNVQQHIGNLGRLVQDNALQRSNFSDLETRSAAQLEEMASALNAYTTFGLAAARAVLALGERANSTEETRSLIGRMDGIEAHDLAAQQAAGRAGWTTLVSLLAAFAIALTVFIVLFRAIHRERVARRDTERALHATHELNAALEAKASQLEAINGELESFSCSVSHDLRAPLRAIDGFALMIEEDYGERLDGEGRRYLSVIREHSKRMGALIDNLLAFSRLGRLPVVTREVNVETLVREVIEEVLRASDASRPHVEVGPLPTAQGDRALLRQVWMNLVSNAVKYSSKAARPCIAVHGQRNADENLYSIRDNGVGFDMKYAKKMFGVFQRLHRADEFSGTGVGLAIVQRVVAKHGGRVWAEGKVDQGAVFSFALPAGGAFGQAVVGNQEPSAELT